MTRIGVLIDLIANPWAIVLVLVVICGALIWFKTPAGQRHNERLEEQNRKNREKYGPY